MSAGIDQIVLAESYRASAVCDVLAVSRSGVYAWRSQEESLRENEDQEMGPLIDEIFWHHRRRYRNGAEALHELASYIGYYNGERLHSSLGYVSPIEFERQQPVQK